MYEYVHQTLTQGLGRTDPNIVRPCTAMHELEGTMLELNCIMDHLWLFSFLISFPCLRSPWGKRLDLSIGARLTCPLGSSDLPPTDLGRSRGRIAAAIWPQIM